MNRLPGARRAIALISAICLALLFTAAVSAEDGSLTYTISGVSNGQADVAKNPTFVVKFSDNMAAASVKDTNRNSFILEDSNSNVIPL
ncbi:MAG: hypothetical protein IKS04_05575, partial [Clostridia bacterium]|nr:hypothetical protein [Clostridia bacterium]